MVCLCLLGTMLGINWILLFEAYRYTSMATATLCYYLAPIFIVAISPFVFKEKMTLKKVLCIVVALIGMIFVSGVIKNGIPKSSEIKGILLGIGAAILYATIVVTNLINIVVNPIYELGNTRKKLIMQHKVVAEPFLFDEVSKNEPVEFQIFFRTGDYEYRYYLSTLKSEIFAEILDRKKLVVKSQLVSLRNFCLLIKKIQLII